MGRTSRKKRHTHVADEGGLGGSGGGAAKTFVMERGKVGRVLSQLVLDLRHIMEPYTASKLKVRQRNVLKDFVHVAGPLGVTHFIIVSKTEQYINLKVCRLPRGPTLTFHINAFSLSCEVVSNLKKPLSIPHQFLTPAMLIMNNFPSDEKPSKLMSTMFQNMFPSINVQTVKLSNLKRCVLLRNNPDSNTVELRHYAIRAQARGVSKGIKTLAGSHVPDLGRYQDISEYVLGGQGSDSEGEELGGEGDVILPQDLPGRGNALSQQSVVKLSELGPRLTLQLVKVEAGLCEGEVLYHAFIHKSKKEQRTLKKKIEGAKRLRADRRRQQEANVARKRRERELHRQQSMKGVASRCEGGDGVEGEGEESEEEEDDDVEWYRQEVGQEGEGEGEESEEDDDVEWYRQEVGQEGEGEESEEEDDDVEWYRQEVGEEGEGEREESEEEDDDVEWYRQEVGQEVEGEREESEEEDDDVEWYRQEVGEEGEGEREESEEEDDDVEWYRQEVGQEVEGEREESEEEDDDVEWYRQEVGEEPDPDTFTSSGGSKPRPTAGLKRRKKSAHGPSAPGPQSKRQRLTTTDNRAAAARDGYSSNKQRRKGGVLSSHRRKGQQASSSRPVVRFADKRKRTVKGRQFQGDGGGGVKRRAGGQIFRTRAKAS